MENKTESISFKKEVKYILVYLFSDPWFILYHLAFIFENSRGITKNLLLIFCYIPIGLAYIFLLQRMEIYETFSDKNISLYSFVTKIIPQKARENFDSFFALKHRLFALFILVNFVFTFHNNFRTKLIYYIFLFLAFSFSYLSSYYFDMFKVKKQIENDD